MNNRAKSLNIKECKLLELLITQTRHPKNVADGVDPLLALRFAKATQVKILIVKVDKKNLTLVII